jgi:peptidoglycan L-alanyl-D-glutamate endopeptidase CwlK
MPLGPASLRKLASAQPELRQLFEAVAEGVDRGECPGVRDITIICGFRGQKEQNEAFERGASKLQWPNSKHNQLPSRAVDAAPYPIDWTDTKAFGALRRYVLEVADRIGVRIRIIDWDWPHYELAAERLPR